MPPFRRWRWRRRQTARTRRPRRFWFRRRRFRRTLQRRRPYRRFWVRKLRKLFRRKKLKYLPIRQWQPKNIKKCHIRGFKCLFWAGPDRDSNNYAQYQQSFTHPHQSGGGGWSLLVFSLQALWEEHQLDRNWWTTGNKNLPLVRYNGCKFKFYREEYNDYAVQYSLCYPMLDGKYTHANATPYNMLLQKHRIIVQSKRTKPYGKPYVKKYFKPPAQLYNKWYFQADFAKTGLLMLTTTAISLNSFYVPITASSNNISIWTLNPKTWKKNGFIHPETTGYKPNANLYLYCIPDIRTTTTKIGDLNFLGRPGPYTVGTSIKNLTNEQRKQYTSNNEHWGNPFHPWVLNNDIKVYKSNVQPSNIFTIDTSGNLTNKDEDISSKSLTLLTEPLIQELRYNPDADTGDNTYVYLYSIERDVKPDFPVPEDPNVKITGFPLHIALWGWLDWQKKLKYLHNIDSSYTLVIRTPYTEPKVEYIIPIDKNFLEGKGPYGLPHDELNYYSLNSWWPKVAHQMVTTNNICRSGPGTCKYEKVRAIQAHCSYDFRFRWGGCPAPMVDLTDPALQTKYPLPGQLIQRLQVQDPTFKPELEIHDFDERQQTITKKCIERLRSFTDTEQTIPSITGITNPPTKTTRQKIQEEIQKSSPEKEDETIQQQLFNIRYNQHRIKRALLRLMEQNIE
nr:MAG: ORF1 [TTV-like mini virus]